ncbi:HypC/HybG/HupF family hydrogenase formation chaperone [Candidatus Sumerlaeota bacterium]|nr:HypC/HybG/HupF family hydrogenase formation chaperone [Candidatus Sumerlaeota bacterium]
MCLGIPGRIESIDNEDALARSGTVRFGGVGKTVNLAYVPEAEAGDYVIVHVGFAISVIDAEEAEKTLAMIEEMEGLADLEEASPGESS